jgi:hypothetical protein
MMVFMSVARASINFTAGADRQGGASVLKAACFAIGAMALPFISIGTVAASAQSPSKASDIRVSTLGGTPAQNGDEACVVRALAVPFRPEHYIVNRVEFYGSGSLESATYNCAAKQRDEMFRARAKPTVDGMEAVAVAAAGAAGLFSGDASQVAGAMRRCASQSFGDGESWKWVNAGNVAVSCSVTNGLFVGRISSPKVAPCRDAAINMLVGVLVSGRRDLGDAVAFTHFTNAHAEYSLQCQYQHSVHSVRADWESTRINARDVVPTAYVLASKLTGDDYKLFEKITARCMRSAIATDGMFQVVEGDTTLGCSAFVDARGARTFSLAFFKRTRGENGDQEDEAPTRKRR